MRFMHFNEKVTNYPGRQGTDDDGHGADAFRRLFTCIKIPHLFCKMRVFSGISQYRHSHVFNHSGGNLKIVLGIRQRYFLHWL